MLKLPKTANFVDYSGIALDYTTGRMAILSQEDSAFWVSQRYFNLPAIAD